MHVGSKPVISYKRRSSCWCDNSKLRRRNMTYQLRHPAVVLAAFTVLAFFWCSTAFAQFETRPVHRNFYWVNLGVGGTGFGGAYGLGLTGQFGLHLFSFHCATAYNVESSEVGTEFSVLYGIGRRGEKGAFSIAVGAGRVIVTTATICMTSNPCWGFPLSPKYLEESGKTLDWVCRCCSI